MSIDEHNNKELAAAARNGEVEAFAALYERYYASMVWVAYSVLFDVDLAEDAAQQAFATACERITDLRQAERFGPWLARICRNAALTIVRQRKRQAGLQARAGSSGQVDAELGEFDAAVKEAIDNLPGMYREIIALRYYNQMSYQEIQSVLGISVDMVKGRLARARRKIQSRLKSNGFERE